MFGGEKKNNKSGKHQVAQLHIGQVTQIGNDRGRLRKVHRARAPAFLSFRSDNEGRGGWGHLADGSVK